MLTKIDNGEMRDENGTDGKREGKEWHDAV